MEQDGNETESTGTKHVMRTLPKHEANPFLDGLHLRLGKKRLSVARGSRLIDEDGEIHHTEIVQIKEVDREEFVKLYTANLKVFFELTSAGQKVLRYVLAVVQDAPDTDRIYLHAGDCNERFPGEISKTTFFRGLNELLTKGFLAQSVLPSQFFINPHLFFNGDRARFVTEFRRKQG